MKSFIKKYKKILISISLIFIVSGLLLIYTYRDYFIYKKELLTDMRVQKYQDILINEVKINPSNAFIHFRKILKEYPVSYQTCHGLAHQMGHSAYEFMGFEKAMSFQDQICAGGYVHGVIESQFGILGQDKLAKEVKNICRNNASCTHGIGHGLMIANKDDTEKSLSICNTIEYKEKTNCFDGVFMHSFDKEETGIIHSNISVQHAVSLCETSPTYAQLNCYFYLPRIYSSLEKTDGSLICKNIGNEIYRSICFKGYGSMLMKYSKFFDLEKTLKECNYLEDKIHVASCKVGATRYAKFYEDSTIK